VKAILLPFISHLTVVGVGDYLVKEALAAIDIVKSDYPTLRLRFVNIMSLTSYGLGNGGNIVSQMEFDEIFTADKPIICNFHGHPETLKAMLDDYADPRRLHVHGYIESGSTTTPFDMHVRNHTSRYDLACQILEKAVEQAAISEEEADNLVIKYRNKIDDNTAYVKQHGLDMPEIDEWQWKH
jgi:xylulose-5-phosphate/fructose-6-phosphate phosphoketolase